jgi:uncharacterized protein
MKINNIFRFLRRINIAFYVSIFLITNYLIACISYLFPPNAMDNRTEDLFTSLYEKIIYGVIVIPIIETLLFQTLVILVVCRLIKRPKYNLYTAVIISATLFSLNHNYSIYYLIMTFVAGVTLAFAYYIARYRKFNATITIILIHALWNILGFITD